MIRRLVAVVLLTVAPVVALSAAPATAEVNGPCHGEVNGINVDPLPVNDPSQAIKVKKDDSLSWFVGSNLPVRSRSFVLSFAGVDVTVNSGSSSSDSNSTRRNGTVKVGDYAWMGAGLYQVAGVAHLSNGSTCSGAVLIDVEGDPLGTVAGVTGLILTLLGSAGIIAGAIKQGGGRRVQDIIDLINLSTGDGGDAGTDIAPVVTAMGLGGPMADGNPAAPAGSGGPPAEGEGAADPPPPSEVPPKRRKGIVPPSGDPAPGDGATPATPPVTTGAGSGPPPLVTTSAHGGPSSPSSSPSSPLTDAKPPPITGMTTVTAIGTTGKALTDAANQLEGHIDSIPGLSDDQKKKIKDTLGTDTIKDKLDIVTSTTDTIEHFEGMATNTVDTMNRFGVNANGANGLVWLQTMAEATGRLGQKYTDGIVKPILEPITKVANQAGIKADAGDIAKTLLPVQEVGEEASKALLNAGKNVLGGDNMLNQLGKDPVVDDEWRNIRTFN